MSRLLKFNIRLSARGLHTCQQLNAETWKIPERLADIPNAENPPFFNMVEYYFHRACVVAEERLMAVH